MTMIDIGVELKTTTTKMMMMIIVNDNRDEFRCSITFIDENNDDGDADDYVDDDVDAVKNDVYLVAE